MAIQLSTGARNARLDAIETAVGIGAMVPVTASTWAVLADLSQAADGSVGSIVIAQTLDGLAQRARILVSGQGHSQRRVRGPPAPVRRAQHARQGTPRRTKGHVRSLLRRK